MTRVLKPDDLRCKTTGKHCYPTEEAATHRLEIAWTLSQQRPYRGLWPRKVYLCECGWWHLSSQGERVAVDNE